LDWLTRYQNFCQTVTDAPPIYHKYVGMAILGTLLGNTVWFPFGYSRIYCNLWITLIGESTFTHKSAAMNIGKGILSKAHAHLVYPNQFSLESLYTVLQNQPFGMFFHDEFGEMLSYFNRSYMDGAKETFTSLFDYQGIFLRELQSVKIKVTFPRIGLITCSTPDWFVHRLKSEDFSAGFIPRFFLVPATVKDKENFYALPPAYDLEEESNLITDLRKLGEIEGTASFGAPAKALHDLWVREFYNTNLRGVSANLSRRFQEYFIKFAMIFEASDSGQCRIISEESAQKAMECVGDALGTISQLDDDLAFTAGRKNINTIVRYLKKHGSSNVGAILRGTGLTKKQYEPAIDTLKAEDRINEQRGDQKGGGRKGLVISLKNPD